VRSKSNIVILVIAVVMGALAVFLARSFIQGQSQETVTTVRKIVVAAVPLDVGTVLAPHHLTEISWGGSSLPDGAFTNKAEFLAGGKRFALLPIARNEPVLRSKVADSSNGGFLSASLGANMRAVTVRVDDVSGVAGFIMPGSRVDVALIRTARSGDGQTTASDIILENIKVLATDQVTGVSAEKAAMVARAVTLEVDSEQAQKVLIAEKVGRLSLILRQAGEANSGSTRRITERDLLNLPLGPARAEAKEIVEPARRPETTTVTIVRGAKPEEYSVKSGN
jgi:pilus assembly protein CpaB